jgi:hypothetical protein
MKPGAATDGGKTDRDLSLRLIRRDPVALRPPILGNQLPFLLCDLLILGFSAFEQGETA